ncbi:hypothetical protein ILYODFUR_038229 [Ilyodon furcidens]|uniref:Uncharacterized protein n=1 Tax=Ilyodon furcidens TaxID=33524 RepID=A0ABV0UQB9_9TELE
MATKTCSLRLMKRCSLRSKRRFSESENLDRELPQPRKDPLLQLVSLQKASGCWLLDADLTAVLGKTREEVEKAKPASVGHCLK